MEFQLARPIRIGAGGLSAEQSLFRSEDIKAAICYWPGQTVGGWALFEEQVKSVTGRTTRGQIVAQAQPFSSCGHWADELFTTGKATEACKDAIDAAIRGVELNEAGADAQSISPDDRQAELKTAIADAIVTGQTGAADCETTGFSTFYDGQEREVWRASCASHIASAMADILGDRVALRSKIRRQHPGTDFSQKLCIDELRTQQIIDSTREVKTDAFAIDLTFSLDGTVRAEVAPNAQKVGNEALSAQRSRGAISDGLNAITIDDVPIVPVVRRMSQKSWRYRQVIHVNQSCTQIKGHPCAYPSADANAYTRDGDATGRAGPCQRPAQHQGRWYDTDTTVANTAIIKPFKVLVDTYHLGPADSTGPDSVSNIRGASVRAVHSLCEDGVAGACPQDRERECTGTFPFNAAPIVATAPSAGVTESELTQGTAGMPKPAERDTQWAVNPSPLGVDLLVWHPEYVKTAIVKDFEALHTIGDSYQTAQVLLSGVAVNLDDIKAEDAGPEGTRFENHRFTEAYFQCTATLEEIEQM